MSDITFKATVENLKDWMIVRLPKDASSKLPSRGMTLVEGTVGTVPFKTALEPDGQGSHWLNIDKNMQTALRTKAGDTVQLTIRSSKDWPEPDIPADIKKALDTNPEFKKLWMDTTPMARWDWIRWIRATNNPATRANHIEVAYSKLKHGTKRPCCFNRSMCTEPAISKSGVLLTAV